VISLGASSLLPPQQQMRAVASLFVKGIGCNARRYGRASQHAAHGDYANGRVPAPDHGEQFKSDMPGMFRSERMMSGISSLIAAKAEKPSGRSGSNSRGR